VTYAAKQGETLLAVAARFRTTAKSILSLNFDVALAAVERSVAFALALVLLGSRRPASLSRCPSPSLLALCFSPCLLSLVTRSCQSQYHFPAISLAPSTLTSSRALSRQL